MSRKTKADLEAELCELQYKNDRLREDELIILDALITKDHELCETLFALLRRRIGPRAKKEQAGDRNKYTLEQYEYYRRQGFNITQSRDKANDDRVPKFGEDDKDFRLKDRQLQGVLKDRPAAMESLYQLHENDKEARRRWWEARAKMVADKKPLAANGVNIDELNRLNEARSEIIHDLLPLDTALVKCKTKADLEASIRELKNENALFRLSVENLKDFNTRIDNKRCSRKSALMRYYNGPNKQREQASEPNEYFKARYASYRKQGIGKPGSMKKANNDLLVKHGKRLGKSRMYALLKD